LGLRPSGLALRAGHLLPGGEGPFGRLVPLPLGEGRREAAGEGAIRDRI